MSYLWLACNAVYLFGIGATKTTSEGNQSALKAYLTIPVGTVIVVGIFMDHLKRKRGTSESEPIVGVAKSILSAIYLLQLVFIALRLDLIITWKWSITLLPFWFFFAIIILFTMVTLLRFIASILDLMTGRNKDWSGILLNFWIAANLVGGLVFAAKIQVGIVQIQEKTELNTKELCETVLGMLLFLAALGLLTTISLSCIM